MVASGDHVPGILLAAPSLGALSRTSGLRQPYSFTISTSARQSRIFVWINFTQLLQETNWNKKYQEIWRNQLSILTCRPGSVSPRKALDPRGPVHVQIPKMNCSAWLDYSHRLGRLHSGFNGNTKSNSKQADDSEVTTCVWLPSRRSFRCKFIVNFFGPQARIAANAALSHCPHAKGSNPLHIALCLAWASWHLQAQAVPVLSIYFIV